MCSCMSFVSSLWFCCAVSLPPCVGHLIPSRPPTCVSSSTRPPVLLLCQCPHTFSCSHFWALQGSFRCVACHAATAPEILRSLSSSSPNQRPPDVRPHETVMSIRPARMPLVRHGWSWSSGLPRARSSNNHGATTSAASSIIAVCSCCCSHVQGGGSIESWWTCAARCWS